MDKLELDDRVSRLERRVSMHSLLVAVAGLMVLGAAFFMITWVSTSRYEEATATIDTPAPTPPALPLMFEFELRKAHEMQHQGLITQEDLEQKKEMILAEPMTFTDDVEAMKAAKALLSQGVLNQSEYEIIKRKILKFGK